jgi:predicted  nucleic acid-binding Zn-ribbon protein
MKKTKAKEITTDALARMVQEGFKEMNSRFERVDGGFGDMDDRFDALEKRLDAMELELIDIRKKVGNVVYRHELEALKDRVAVIEKKLALLRR